MRSRVRMERVDFPAPAERDDRREPHRGTVLQLVSQDEAEEPCATRPP
jgi:hypothetical protein